MKTSAIAILLNLALSAYAAPPFDPSGAKNIGNGQGLQFITGQCLSDADCGSTCCANPTGICSGLGAQFQNGKTGCGFVAAGAAAPAHVVTTTTAVAAPVETSTTNSTAGTGASSAPANGGPPFDPSGAKNVGNGKGLQFITGQCLSDADCGSGCCAGPSGICSGLGAQLQNGKTGCGFSSI
ncbi:MAG: hypothetical protein MMC33_005454 [Icmadophila ericetorum]|nr:hypothetical protein [Icmadophila ericetorum]